MTTRNKNNIDFGCYVALGDSITAGYTDGALFYEGQQCSYPKLIAKQLKLIGGSLFKQPLMKPDSVGIGFTGNSRLILKHKEGISDRNEFSLTYLSPKGDSSAFLENNYLKEGPFNNMGVPAAKVISLLISGLGNIKNGEGNYNPFFSRMASDPVKASILSDVLNMEPTFFTMYIGNNDALTYALSGATLDGITPLSGRAGVGFKESFQVIVDSLTSNGAKGAFANITDILSIPFFTVIPYNGLILNTQTCLELNDKFNKIGCTFVPGKNPFVIYDSIVSPNNIRQIQNGEMILYDILLDPDRDLFLKGLSPIPKKYILTKDEIERIQFAINEYNEIIRAVVTDKGLAYVDVNATMNNAKQEGTYNPESLDLIYNKRSAFSLDGLHPNALGQALLANEFIRSINKTYGTEIPLIKIIKYKRKIMP